MDTLRPLHLPGASTALQLHSLAALEEQGLGRIGRLPVSLRMLLESMLRNCDGVRVSREQVKGLCAWQPQAPRTQEIPFIPARILLQDLNGVPLVADMAAMRDTAASQGLPASLIEPQVPVHLVVDHSVQVDHAGTPSALVSNMAAEFERNLERFAFLKWGAKAFDGISVVEPGIGICHQVNLERLATGVSITGGIVHPDSVVCPDSHTTMITGLGILGWGVGGIEAEAGMLGQPVFFLTPDVVGVELLGRLRPGVTATDAVLWITQKLRQAKVVGDFVEFCGEGTAALPVPTRATIANMAPEYGAFLGYFPPDERTMAYYEETGRDAQLTRAYLQAQGLLGVPSVDAIDYSRVLRLDLAEVEPCVAGPSRPQDRVPLQDLPQCIGQLSDGQRFAEGQMQHGDLLVAAITSCTNTSNPSVMVAAGLLARKAVALGLRVPPRVKTSLAPGSRAVSALLERAGLLEPLEQLGFAVVAYGCTTCIGNSGPLDAAVEAEVNRNGIVGCAVLSGNRNFEGRIHGSIRANFLASPPLVVAFALAGRMGLDLACEPLGRTAAGEPVFLRDLWPSDEEIEGTVRSAATPGLFADAYRMGEAGTPWAELAAPEGDLYAWPASNYIVRPPFFDGFSVDPPKRPPLAGARALGIYGNSLTTDHISPAGSIPVESAAGAYLRSLAIEKQDFNSYGARRGNHEVMVRGTFAHARIRNQIIPSNPDGSRKEGGYTLLMPEQQLTTVFDAAQAYHARGVPAFVFGGQEYGTGSARDWAAKGTRLLHVSAVIVGSFERIHRSNLVLMGVLPLEFREGHSVESLGITGTETFDLEGLDELSPRKEATLRIRHTDGRVTKAPLLLRLDTAIEVLYYLHGGITPYVLRQLFARAPSMAAIS